MKTIMFKIDFILPDGSILTLKPEITVNDNHELLEIVKGVLPIDSVDVYILP